MANLSPSGFSYAQAARGQASTVTSQAPPNKATPGTVSPSLGTPSTMGQNSNWADDVESAVVGEKSLDSQKTNSEHTKLSQPKDSAVERAKAEGIIHNGSSGVSSPDLAATPSTATNSDDSSSAPGGTSSSDTTWENKSQSSEPAWIKERHERQSTSQPEEGSKSKREKKETKEVKEAKEAKEPALPQPQPKPVILHEAPPPAVNPWAKRMEVARPKTVAVPAIPQTPKPAPISSAPNEIQRPSSDPRKQSSSMAGVSREAESRIGSMNDSRKQIGPQGMRTNDVRKVGQGLKPGPEDTRADSIVAAPRAPHREHQDLPDLTTIPPSVKDEVSWPTPESAQEKERKELITEKETKEGDEDAAAGAKTHQKTKWKAMSVTPTIVWETEEMNRPPRGQNGDRGGRGGNSGRGRGSLRGTAHGSKGGERAAPRNTGSPSDDEIRGSGRQRGRSNTVDREAMPPPPRSFRQVSSSGSHDRQSYFQARLSAGAIDEGAAASAADLSNFSRTKSPSTVDAASADVQHDVRTQELIPRQGPAVPGDEGRGVAELARDVTTTKRVFSDGKKDSRSDGYNGREWNGPPRGGKRGGRGRGGSREYANSHQAFATEAPPYGVPPSPSTYQSHRGQFNFSQQARGGWPRGNSRSQSIPVDNSYGGRSAQYWPAQQLPPVQTYYPGMYEYTGMPMTAIPYHPMIDQQYLMDTVSTQLEYYFSLDNLLKDMFLRKNMDSQGFVLLEVITSFNRIKHLTTDKDILKAVCLRSENIEIRVGEDGKERLRRSQGWEQFVLPKDQRESGAQNDGPSVLQRPELPQLWMPSPGFRGPHSAGILGGRRSYDSGLPGNAAGPQISPFSPLNETPYGELLNGDESRGRSAKSPPLDNIVSPAHASSLGATEEQDSGPDVFPDDQASTLTVVVKMHPQRSSQPHAVSRTFSNGSIDTRSIFGEMEGHVQSMSNGEPTANGDSGGASADRHASRSPEKSNQSSDLMLLWVKDREFPQESLPQDATLEPYFTLRKKALGQREQAATGACPYDLDVLYQFWSHFLIRNFNKKMYREFKGYAHNDAQERHSGVGLQNLVQFYSKALASSNPMRDQIVKDYVELVKSDLPILRGLAFQQLRKAWRNGALNLKNRKKLADIIDEPLKSSLESA